MGLGRQLRHRAADTAVGTRNHCPLVKKAAGAPIGFLAVIEVVLEHMLQGTPTGWSSLMAAMLLLSGTQLLLLGILGEYVGRIYLGISEKPQSVVRETVRSGSAAS